MCADIFGRPQAAGARREWSIFLLQNESMPPGVSALALEASNQCIFSHEAFFLHKLRHNVILNVVATSPTLQLVWSTTLAVDECQVPNMTDAHNHRHIRPLLNRVRAKFKGPEAAKPYQYSPLNDDKDEIQFLTILPDKRSSSKVRMSLSRTSFTLPSNLQFQALSYAWGSTDNPVEILIARLWLRNHPGDQKSCPSLTFHSTKDGPCNYLDRCYLRQSTRLGMSPGQTHDRYLLQRVSGSCLDWA